jgi:hypothetical protein
VVFSSSSHPAWPPVATAPGALLALLAWAVTPTPGTLTRVLGGPSIRAAYGGSLNSAGDYSG